MYSRAARERPRRFTIPRRRRRRAAVARFCHAGVCAAQLMDNGTLRLYDSKSLPVWFSSLVGPHEELVHIKPKKPGDVDDDHSQSYGDSDEESVPDSRRSYD